MGCSTCRGSGGNRHNTSGPGLEKFGYLTPKQLRLLKQQKEAVKGDKDKKD